MANLDKKLEKLASGPKSVSTDGTKVDAQSVDEVIKADQYLAAKDAAKKPNRGLRFNKLVPPGTA